MDLETADPECFCLAYDEFNVTYMNYLSLPTKIYSLNHKPEVNSEEGAFCRSALTFS
jgi:hypothetical protein